MRAPHIPPTPTTLHSGNFCDCCLDKVERVCFPSDTTPQEGPREKEEAQSHFRGWWLLCNKDPGATDTSPHSLLRPLLLGSEMECRVAGARKGTGAPVASQSVVCILATTVHERFSEVGVQLPFCHPVDYVGLCCGLAAAGLAHGQC